MVRWTHSVAVAGFAALLTVCPAWLLGRLAEVGDIASGLLFMSTLVFTAGWVACRVSGTINGAMTLLAIILSLVNPWWNAIGDYGGPSVIFMMLFSLGGLGWLWVEKRYGQGPDDE